ncbi:hypothetical protein H8356DRAFT_1430515 [Neocallimastix lanati (nom. inval.)]|nr:hypothetical protein H8356DRAFT_1430515 [Neocallimastix sp. JGI-2020a]
MITPTGGMNGMLGNTTPGRYVTTLWQYITFNSYICYGHNWKWLSKTEKNQEIEICKTNRGKEQIILNRKYKFLKMKFQIVQLFLIYNSIKSQVTRSRRKQLPPDITTFDEIPNES